MVLVIGSGAGGSTVAMELAKSGIPVTVIEKGPLIKTGKAYKCYQPSDSCLDLLNTVCIGGSTLVSAGNAVRTSAEYMKEMGINLSNEFNEIELELNVKELPDSHFGRGTLKLMEAASKLDFKVQKMPKFINPKNCKPCGKCSLGCPQNAKWTALDFIHEAKKYGAEILPETAITDIVTKNGRVTGVKSYDKLFKSSTVILAPGAITTPKLLQKIGLNAGEKFFMDTFVTVGGVLEGIGFNEEVQMNALIECEDYIISPHYSSLIFNQLKDFGAKEADILGLMVKIKDESSGRVEKDKIIKYNTLNDVKFLCEASAKAGTILLEAGVDPKTIVSTPPRGAHPGGTAPIGKVVNKNLETEIQGLYVTDASVLPKSPGLPPILTIIALAKRLAKHITNN
ncbi:MAG: FAD-dependent oxidoreductase [Methanobacteriaceae archaeon]|jgi:choline dehydrogenase-like flavoprotein|nr:FAD-dependent oxidoreductase [Methanobacteriaceae archaeon]